MTTMTAKQGHDKLRAMVRGATNRYLIGALTLIVADGPERDEATRMTADYLMDELSERSSAVNEALDAWELDLESAEDTTDVVLRAALSDRTLLPDAKRG